jgi:hypothetical protein
MRFIAKTLLLVFLAAISAYAQQGTIQHIIVVVQENRTPDNLFQDPNLIAAGADIVSIGTGGMCGTTPVPLTKRPLSDCVNPNHNHNVGWLPSFDGGKMDGACKESYGSVCSPYPPACPNGNYQYCPQYAYVDKAAAPSDRTGTSRRGTGTPITCFKRVRAQAFPLTSFYCREARSQRRGASLSIHILRPRTWTAGSCKMLDATPTRVKPFR